MAKDTIIKFRVTAEQKSAFYARCKALKLDPSEILRDFVIADDLTGLVDESEDVVTKVKTVATKEAVVSEYVATNPVELVHVVATNRPRVTSGLDRDAIAAKIEARRKAKEGL